MSKINDQTDYPPVTPADGDLVIGTDVSDVAIDVNGETANFTMSAIRTFFKTTYDTLYQPLATVLTNTTASFTTAQETKLSGIETAADVTDAGNVGTSMTGATAKTTLADADTIPLNDSAASNVLKKITWTNFKAAGKTYFDTLYATTAVIPSATYVTTGTEPTYAITPSPAYTAYFTGMTIKIAIHAANSGNAYVNVNGLGAKALQYYDLTNALAFVPLNRLNIGDTLTAVYNGTVFVITSFENQYTQFIANTQKSVTDGASIAINMLSLGTHNLTVTLAGNRNMNNPVISIPGANGIIEIVQDATGSRTLTWSTYWKFDSGTDPVLTTTAGAKDYVLFYVVSSTVIICRFVANPS